MLSQLNIFAKLSQLSFVKASVGRGFQHFFLILLIFLCCLLPALAQQADKLTQQQKTEPPPKPILDAPSLQISAQPYYKTTLQQLGYENLGQLLDYSVQAQSRVNSVAWSGRGELASGSDDGTVKVWDAGSGELLKTLQAESSMRSVAWSVSGELASGSDDGTVKVWDVGSGELLKTLPAHTGWVGTVAWSVGGQLASGSSDGTVKVWDAGSGELLKTLKAQSLVLSVAWSERGQLASGSSDGTVRVWDAGSGELLKTLKAQDSVNSVAWNERGQLAVGSDNSTVQVWDAGSGELLKTLKAHTEWVNSVAWSESGELASGSDDGTVQVWDAGSGELLKTLQAQSRVFSVAWSGRGELASGSSDGTVKVWDTGSGELLKILQAQGSVSSVAWSGRGELASGTYNGMVQVWDVDSGELLKTLQAQDSVNSVAWNESGQLASGSSDGTVRVWDAGSGELLKTLKAQDSVNSVAWNESGQLAVGSSDGTVRVWDAGSGELLKTLKAESSVNSVAWSESGELASGSDDGTVQAWDAGSGELLKTLKAHKDSVRTVAWSGRGELASGSDDRMVKLWDAGSGELLRTLQVHKDWVRAVAWSRSGQLASGSDDGTVRLWKDGELEQTLIAQADGAWLNVKPTGEVWRGDAGKILLQGVILAEGQYTVEEPEKDKDDKPTGKILKREDNYKSTKWDYLSFPNSQATSLVVSLEKPTLTASAEKANLFTVQLTNTSNESIYHPRILETTSADGSLKIIPTAYLPTYPQTKALPSELTVIPAQGKAKVAARLLAINAKAGTYEIPLKIEVWGGQVTEQLVSVEIQKPRLEIKDSDYSTATNSVVLQLHNADTTDVPNAQLFLVDSAGRMVSKSQTVDKLKANSDTVPLAFQLAEDVPWWQLLQLQLAINPNQPAGYVNWRTSAKLYTVWLMPVTVALSSLALLLGGFYFRRYRHPLVLQLGEQPQQFRTLPLEQLPEAQQRLKQTGRLKTVLDTAGIGAEGLQKALAFPTQNASQKAERLAERLSSQLETFSSTNELFKLSLPANFPLNLTQILLYFPQVEAEEAFAHLETLPKEQGDIVLILGKDAEYQRKLLNTTQERGNLYVAPQSSHLTALLLAPNANEVLANLLSEQLNLNLLSPYQLKDGVKQASVFFGREKLLAQVLNQSFANYFIVGARQIGKTSLLKALKRGFQYNPKVACYYISCSGTKDVLTPLQAELGWSADKAQFEQLLSQYVRQQHKTFVFLIDEADEFIADERAQGYPTLSLFRRFTEQEQCYFIFAGFWQLYQYAVLDYHSPLRNFGEVLQVGALEKQACVDLTTVPMSWLKLSYANPNLVSHLITQCGQRANLIAFVCDQIIKNARADQRIIEAGDVHKALASEALKSDSFQGWESLGRDESEEAYNRLIVYSTIDKPNFSRSGLVQTLEQNGIPFEMNELNRTLSRLELAFILKKHENRWSYHVPLFIDYIREDDWEFMREQEWRRWKAVRLI